MSEVCAGCGAQIERHPWPAMVETKWAIHEENGAWTFMCHSRFQDDALMIDYHYVAGEDPPVYRVSGEATEL